MLKFDSKAVNASKLFTDGYVTDVYFDTHRGESNFLIAEVSEVVAWIRQSGEDTAKEIGNYFNNGYAADAEAISATLMELATNLIAIEALDASVKYIIFDDGKLF